MESNVISLDEAEALDPAAAEDIEYVLKFNQHGAIAVDIVGTIDFPGQGKVVRRYRVEDELAISLVEILTAVTSMAIDLDREDV